VTLLHEVCVLDGGDWEWGRGLRDDGDAAFAVVGAKVVLANTSALLAGNVELPVSLPHATVRDGHDPIVDNGLGWGRLHDWLLALEVDVLAVWTAVGDGAGFKGKLGSGGGACEVARVEDKSANPRDFVRGVDGLS